MLWTCEIFPYRPDSCFSYKPDAFSQMQINFNVYSFHSLHFPSQVSNEHSFFQVLKSKELLLKFNVGFFLGIFMFNHSHLKIFIVPFIWALYVSISLYPWCLIYRHYKLCSALETEQEVLHHRGDMVQKNNCI